MSDAVLIAIISAAAAVVAAMVTAWIELRKHRGKKTENDAQSRPTLVQVNNAIVLPPFSAKQPEADTSPKDRESRSSIGWTDLLEAPPAPEPPVQSVREITPILHRDIVAQIEGVAPFLQESVKQKFIGLRVVWRASLFSISRYSKYVEVSAEILNPPCFLDCETTEQHALRLINSQRGAEIEVDGTIARVSTATCRLENCEVRPVVDLPAAR